MGYLALVSTDHQIAVFLGRNNITTAKGNRWSRDIVTSFRCYHRIPIYSKERRVAEQYLTIEEVIEEFHVAGVTLREAVAAGRLTALHPLVYGPWIFRRPDVTEWRRRSKGGRSGDQSTGPNSPQLSLKIPGT
jgi:hypothetical protein